LAFDHLEEHDMKAFIADVRAFMTAEDGQDLIEYALLAALIALGAVVAMQATGTSVNSVFDSIKTQLSSAVPA
jgi:pilus assembly protein Flp/PilA